MSTVDMWMLMKSDESMVAVAGVTVTCGDKHDDDDDGDDDDMMLRERRYHSYRSSKPSIIPIPKSKLLGGRVRSFITANPRKLEHGFRVTCARIPCQKVQEDQDVPTFWRLL